MRLIKRHYPIGGGAILLAVAMTLGAASRRDEPDTVTLPAHTAIRVTLDQSLASNHSRPGEHFDATVSDAVVADGKVVIPQGSHVEGMVMDAEKSGRLVGRPRLLLELQTVQVDGQSYDVRTMPDQRIGRGHKKHNFTWIAGGAAGGALIGAVAAGGTGALIGGPVGAGAGTTVALLRGKRDIKLPAETQLKFELSEPATIPAAKVGG